MHRTRREFLVDAGAVATLSTARGSALAAPGKAKLEPWRYGNGSYDPDTQLMFRGKPRPHVLWHGPDP
ncbi:MAG: hypothetical protein GY877_07935 [Hyphomicrobium sp.]|nr:hypothetical protein [Hyphomicrobium sp.]